MENQTISPFVSPLNGMLDMSVQASLSQHAALQYRSTKEEFHEFYKIQKIRILKSSTMDVTIGSSDHPTRIMKGNNSLTRHS